MISTSDIARLRREKATRLARQRQGAPRPAPAPIREGAWNGRRAFVVGGGPSLRGFDFSRLRGERIIAVNRAFEVLPFAEILFSMDYRYYGYAVRTAAFREFRGRKVWLDTMGYPYVGVETLRMSSVEGLSWSLASGLATGANSGHGAVNLALLLGADPVYLLGFDFAEDEKGSHFHSGYPFVRKDGKLDEYRTRLEAIAPDVLAKGRRIVNLSPASKLEGFPRERFEDLPRTRDFVATSYYTDDEYRRLADRLRISLERFGIRSDIREVRSRGSWIKNVELRAEFLKGLLADHPDDNIVWIDADGIVERYPILFHELEGYDLAAHYLDRRSGRELLGGTLFLSNTEATRGIMDEWIEESRRLERYKDQRGLQNLLERFPKRLRVFELPATYTQIFDSMRGAGSPVIEHFQASRRFRYTAR